MTTVFIGIGSNIDPKKNITACAQMLRENFPDITFSHVYHSGARDVEEQDDFLNAAATFDTTLSAQEVHRILLSIEETLQKNLPYPKGPRTIDLDILTFGTMHIDTEDLEVPHPRMKDRRFVLEPLCDLSQQWKDDLQKTLDQSCQRADITL